MKDQWHYCKITKFQLNSSWIEKQTPRIYAEIQQIKNENIRLNLKSVEDNIDKYYYIYIYFFIYSIYII